MRSHSQIVKDHGATALVRSLAGLGVEVALSTPQRWAERDSIPSEHWKSLVELGIAALEELAEGAAARRAGSLDEPAEAAR